MLPRKRMSIPWYIVHNKSLCCAEGTLIDHASPVWIKTQLLVGMKCEICHPIIFSSPWSCKAESMLHGYLWIKARDGCLLFCCCCLAPLEAWFHSNSPDHLLRWLIHLHGSDIDEPASHWITLNNGALHQSQPIGYQESRSSMQWLIPYLSNIWCRLCLWED